MMKADASKEVPSLAKRKSAWPQKYKRFTVRDQKHHVVTYIDKNVIGRV